MIDSGPSSASLVSSASSTFSNDISSDIAGLIETELHVEPPCGRGTQVCS